MTSFTTVCMYKYVYILHAEVELRFLCLCILFTTANDNDDREYAFQHIKDNCVAFSPFIFCAFLKIFFSFVPSIQHLVLVQPRSITKLVFVFMALNCLLCNMSKTFAYQRIVNCEIS